MALPSTPTAVPASAGGTVTEEKVGDWLFHAEEHPIGSREEYEHLPDVVGCPSNVPLPEMLFARNFLEITNEKKGLKLRFDACGALRSWHAVQTAANAEHEAEKGPIGPTNFDWTFWNEYDGEVDGPVEPAADGEGLPLSLLRRRDAILFFAELPLYEDDLHDKGEVTVSVKVRVMESCFLVLLRTFLRLDADRARLREVRWCHRTGSRRFVKDVQVREADAATVLAHMARTGGAASGAASGITDGPAGRPGRTALSPAHGVAVSPGAMGAGVGRVHSADAALAESAVGVHGVAFATPAALPTMPLSGGGLGVHDPSSSSSSATAHADAVGGGSGSHKCPMAGRETVAAEVAMDPSARAPWAAGGALDTRRAHALPPVGGFGAFAPSDARVATGRVWYSAQDVADAVPAKAHRVEEFVWT